MNENILQKYRKLGLKPWEFPGFSSLIVAVIVASFIIILSFNVVFGFMMTTVSLLVLAILFFLVIYSSVSSFNKILEENRIKLEFISLAYHQLRTPLTGMVALLEVMEKQTEAEKEDNIKILEQTTKKALKMISELLEASELETGISVLKKEKVSMVELTSKILLDTKQMAEVLNIRVVFLPNQSPTVWADPQKMEMVIRNLVDNAIEYTPDHGTVSIDISLQGNSSLRFMIKDSGIGIPKEQQRYIFHKFFRTDSAKKKKVNGSGVGLFIAKTIIELQGGQIGFHSTEGEGSEFWFTLPLFYEK